MKYRSLYPLLLLALSACKENEAQFSGLEPAAHIENAVLDFGGVYLEAKKSMTFTLVNDGLIPIDMKLKADDSAPFAVSSLPEYLEANESLDVAVTFEPTQAQEFGFNFEIQTDAGEFTVELMGEGLAWPDCNDLGPCQDVEFNPNAGECQSTFIGGSCDDESLCTQNDRCVEGQCIGEALLCDDGDACTQNLCSPELGCVFDSPTDCNDDNPCTIDSCDGASGGCSNILLPNGSDCDDGSVCTDGDQCIEGSCQGEALSCDDGITCTEDSCDPDLGCENVPQNTRCNDADPCTQDSCSVSAGCSNETVANYTPCGDVDCQEAPLCFFGECVSITPPDGTPCADNNRCTQGDTCQGGTCQAGELVPYFSDLAIGTHHTCALRFDGEVECWGYTQGGESAPPPGPFASLVQGVDGQCAYDVQGKLQCWGYMRDTLELQEENETWLSMSRLNSENIWSRNTVFCALSQAGFLKCWNGTEFLSPAVGPFIEFSGGPKGETPALGCGILFDGQIQCVGYDIDPAFDGAFTHIAATEEYACALRESTSDVVCLALGLDFESPILSPVPGAFAEVVVLSEQACGLRLDGTVECWGDGPSLPELRYAAIRARIRFADRLCGLTLDGEVHCSGAFDAGIINYDVPNFLGENRPFTEPVRAIDRGYDIWWGPDVACVLDYEGTPKCHFGYHRIEEVDEILSQVEVGDEDACGLRLDGSIVCWGATETLKTDTPAGTFIELGVSQKHACALDDEGEAHCWGDSDEGLLEVPAGAFGWLEVDEKFACAGRPGGSVECWGELPTSANVIPPGGDWSSVKFASGRGCGLHLDGSVECWWSDGSLLSNTPSGSFTSIEVKSVRESPELQYSSFSNFLRTVACGIRTDGSMECWTGAYYLPELPEDVENPPAQQLYSTFGLSSRTLCVIDFHGKLECSNWMPPPASHQDSRFTSISMSNTNACALRDDGRPICWGYNFQPKEPENLISISVNRGGLCGLRSDQSAVCWGSNRHRKGSPPGGEFTKVGVGGEHACALRTGGSLECWGKDRTNTSWTSLPEASAGDFMTAVHAADYRTCVLWDDGSIECWGEGTNQVSTIDASQGPFVAVATSSWFTCGLTFDGRPHCVGHPWTSIYPQPNTEHIDPTHTDIRLKSITGGGTHGICGVTIDDQPWCYRTTWPKEAPSSCQGPEVGTVWPSD